MNHNFLGLKRGGYGNDDGDDDDGGGSDDDESGDGGGDDDNDDDDDDDDDPSRGPEGLKNGAEGWRHVRPGSPLAASEAHA